MVVIISLLTTTDRFISADDISYLDPETINGLTLFSYCGNNPEMNVDLSGHIFWTMLIGAIVGAVIGFSGSVISQGLSKWINSF
ncbi:MAG: hypothetical protein J6B79_06345 [Clostridia bacterium]|nr:hypothetical protein [Clostridia bacterium]